MASQPPHELGEAWGSDDSQGPVSHRVKGLLVPADTPAAGAGQPSQDTMVSISESPSFLLSSTAQLQPENDQLGISEQGLPVGGL